MANLLAVILALSAWAAPAAAPPPALDDAPQAVNQALAETTRKQSEFDDLLAHHVAAMEASYQAFNTNTIVVDYTEHSGELLKRITLTWQHGKFRQEYHWIGLEEVFAFDGTDHWYASDMSLPYLLDSGQGVDVTPQMVGYFAYLAPEMRQYLSPLVMKLPLKFDRDYEMMLFSPPKMSQAVLLIDPETYKLDGMLYGNLKEFEKASLFKQTLYQGWREYALCPYPELVTTKTLSLTGDVLRDKSQEVDALNAIAPVDDVLFSRQSAPTPPHVDLPAPAYEVPFSFLDDNVVVMARGPQGQKLYLEVDTGANVGLLRSDVASSMGLKPVGEEHVTGHGGSTIVKYTRVDHVVLEGEDNDLSVELPPWPAAVISGNERFDDSLKEKRISGLLGNFILANFVVKLDFRRRRITLYDPEQFDPETELGPEAHALPVTRDSLPYVHVTVDDKIKGGAFFNTGAQQYFALSAWAAADAGVDYDIISIGTGMTINGLTAFGLIEPKKIEMDHLVIKPSQRTHLELLAPGEAPNPNRIASFGNEFFRHYIVTFDLFHGYYYIEEM